MLENGFKVFELSIVERVNTFGAWELPTLFPQFLDAAAMSVVLCEEVAKNPVSVRHDVNMDISLEEQDATRFSKQAVKSMHAVVAHSCLVYTTHFGIGGAGSPFQTRPDGPPQNELQLLRT